MHPYYLSYVVASKDSGVLCLADGEMAWRMHSVKQINVGGREMKGNIYHSATEEAVDLIRFRISEMEALENSAPDAHLPYQKLLQFFYDVRSIIVND
jgi:hypothetical protein